MTVTESTIGPNNTGYGCAGICPDGYLCLDHRTVACNSAATGGGIFDNSGYSMVLIKSTISHNSAIEDDGGMANNGTANVYNTSIVFNGADSGNSGAGFGGGVRDIGTFNLRSTRVAGNTVDNIHSDDCQGALRTYGNNLVIVTTLSPWSKATGAPWTSSIRPPALARWPTMAVPTNRVP